MMPADVTGVKLDYRAEILAGRRFAFGSNWARFLRLLNDNRIRAAEASLRSLLQLGDLRGKRFLDVGCGSGLFSLAAHRLGAEVRSFDYDLESVACAAELRRRYFPNDLRWVIEAGSVLDSGYLHSIGRWDVVYSWGVLHHSGALWDALANVANLVDKGGLLCVAIYNDQGRRTRRWLRVKQLYNRLPRGLRWTVLVPGAVRLWGPTLVRDALTGHPLRTWRTYSGRGMSPWRDVVDWVGGLPFEVAKPEQVFTFMRERSFELLNLRTCGGGHGNNEFVFRARGDRQ